MEALSQGYSHPKCLFNFFDRTEYTSYKELLENLWLYDFLDATVLEHLQEKETDDLPIMHKINLFAKTYSVAKIKPETKWFPNKLLNLNRHPIKFVVSDNVNSYSSSLRKEYNKFISLFANSMHLSIKIVLYNTEKESSITKLNKEGADMVLDTVVVKGDPRMIIWSFSTTKAVIPDIRKESGIFVISQEFFYMITATVVLIAFVRITALLMKFDSSTWQTFNISQIIMGMSVGREPRHSAERMIFGIFMLNCIVYSGYFFSVILDINYWVEPQISTLEELANSSLTPIITSDKKFFLRTNPNPYIQKLASKSIKFPIFNFDCMTYLAKHQNVSCIMENVEYYVSRFIAKQNELNVKILQEPLIILPRTWLVSIGSPFIDRFNEIILRALNYGLLKKFLELDIRRIDKIVKPEAMEKEKLLYILCYMLIIGYSFAMIAFIGEMMSVIRWSKVKFFCKRCINLVREKIL